MKFYTRPPSPTQDKVKLISLGGFGRVTSNMFVYEYANDILLVDCGMGFPSEDMLGVDILIPDITYLKNKLPNIRGLVLTHGHEDHTGALPYILPQLPPIPIYASRLTASLVMEKLADYQNMPKTVKVFNPGQPIQLGSFSVESVRISHSIPDATNLIIQTPVGTIYHGSDFKFDFTPVDGVQPEVGRIGAAGNSGIKLLLSDCLGSERKGYTPSEKSLDEMFEREISHCPGKFIVTTMSSNISRFRQAAEAAQRHGRRIAILGRSIDRNIKVAQSLDYLKIPSAIMVDSKDIRRIPPHNLCLFVAGSQGQSGSALERIAMGDHRDVTIQPGDKVVFSSDYIPGSESAVQGLIDTLSKLGATVIYSNITDDLHVSGHGSRQDLLLMMSLTRPKFLLPIGGTYRHMVQYSLLAQNMGYQPQAILLPQYNQTIDVTQEGVSLGEKVDVKNIMVDGLGVGDVGSVVLRDRQVLAEEGVVVAVIEVNQNDFSQIANVDLITRGFIFAKENTALLNLATAAVKKSISARQGKIDSTHYIRQLTGDVLENFFWEKTRRRPMILPVIVEV